MKQIDFQLTKYLTFLSNSNIVKDILNAKLKKMQPNFTEI